MKKNTLIFIVHFICINLMIGQTPNRLLDLEEDSGDLIAKFTSKSAQSVGIDLIRQFGNINNSNRDWQIINDNTGIFRIGDSTNGSVFNTQFRLSPTVASVDADFRPLQDNAFDLGSSILRWDNIYATNPTIVTSDIREKKEIHNIEYGLETLRKLRPVSYYWKKGNRDKKLGLIAQEVLELIPEVVNTPDDKDALYGMSYSELVPVLIKAIQEQQLIIDKMQDEWTQVSNLRSKLEILRSQLTATLNDSTQRTSK